MKKIISIAVLIIMACVITAPLAARRPKSKGEISFATKVHDFGIVKENGGPVSVEFPFTNIGTENLLIYEARPDCGCTVPESPKAPIAPGKEGKIKVTYNPLGRPGPFEKVVTVKTNGKPGKVSIKIRGNVVPKGK